MVELEEERRVERLPNGDSVVVTPATESAPQCIEYDVLVLRRDGKDTRVPVKYFYIRRDQDVEHFVAWRDALPPAASGVRELVWDTETDSLDARTGHIATEQFGNPTVADPRVYVADIRCLSPEACRRYMGVVEDPRFLKIAQNAGFEVEWGMHHFGLWPRSLYCTQVAELVLRAGLYEGGQGGKGTGGDDGGNRRAYGATSMAKLVKRYCGPIELDKDFELRTSFYKTPPGQHSVRQIVYAGGDCVHPFYIREAQMKEIEARALRSTLAIEFPLIPVLQDMELRGMGFDAEGWIKLWQQAVVRHEEAERKLDELFLALQGDLFAGTGGAGGSKRRVCEVCHGAGERAVGEGWRKKNVECDPCGGIGRVGGGVRPIFTGGVGKNARPKPLNWGSSPQVKWAIRQYCEKLGWKHELVTTDAQLRKAKRRFGGEWLLKKKMIPLDKEGNPAKTVDDLDDSVIDEVPSYVVPEESHCILISADSDVLVLRMVRGQLPKALIEPLLEFNDQKAKMGTFGRKFLENVGPDGRARFEFHQAITSTGRLSASPNCYDGSTEVLTRGGWTRFDALPDSVADIPEVAEVDPETLKIRFVRATARIRRVADEGMLRFRSMFVDLLVTPGHRMLVEHRSGRREVVEAKDLEPDRKHWHAGRYVGGDLDVTPDEARLLVCVQADGSFGADGRLEFAFKKRRKIERCRDLLDTLGVRHTTTENDTRGRTRFRVAARDQPDCLALLGEAKAFGPWILGLRREALDAFVDELWHWDASFTTASDYASRSKESAEWAQTACALSGVRARLTRQPDAGTTVKADLFHVRVSRRGYSWTTNLEPERVAARLEAHCVEVPSGMLLVRRFDGEHSHNISISGNCMNIPREKAYRHCFVAGKGKKLCIVDYSQQEPRISAFVSRDPVFLRNYELALDLYLTVGEEMLGYPLDPKSPDPEFAKRSADDRQAIKSTSLGLNYRMGVNKLRDKLTLDAYWNSGVWVPWTFFEAGDLHRSYLEKCSGIKEYQEHCFRRADPESETAVRIWDIMADAAVTFIESPCGRKRFFPPDATNVYTEACNFPIQGAGATMTKAAMCLIAKEVVRRGWYGRAYLVNAIHDELVMEADEDIAVECAQMMKMQMEKAGRFYLKDVPIVASFPTPDGTADKWVKE